MDSEIARFLDDRFSSKKKKKKINQGQPKSKDEKMKEAFLKFQQKNQKDRQLDQQMLYSGLQEDVVQDLPKIKESGKDALKRVAFEGEDKPMEELKEKIFYIGQNDARFSKVEPQLIQDPMATTLKQLSDKNAAQQKRKTYLNKLSKNAIKKLEQLQEHQIKQKLFYQDFLTMNKLWKEYIFDLIGQCSNQTTICSKILKAEFCGAIIEVINSKNHTLIGQKGLVYKETARTFQVITEQLDEANGGNKVKCLLKAGSVFQIRLPNECSENGQEGILAVNVWGDNILYKGSERTKIKFKEKFQLDLY